MSKLFLYPTPEAHKDTMYGSTLHVYPSSTGPYLSMFMSDEWRGQGLRLTVDQAEELAETVLRWADGVRIRDTQPAVS